jgi:hypothetical protein
MSSLLWIAAVIQRHRHPARHGRESPEQGRHAESVPARMRRGRAPSLLLVRRAYSAKTGEMGFRLGLSASCAEPAECGKCAALGIGNTAPGGSAQSLLASIVHGFKQARCALPPADTHGHHTEF